MKHPSSDPAIGSALLLKLWLPGLIFAGFGLTSATVLGFVLPSIVSFFFFSAALVKPGEKAVRFRYFYFMPWRQIPYSDIVDCRVSWVPGLGVIKLRRFILPWGKLYFVNGL